MSSDFRIPLDRPVIGRDLSGLRQELGLIAGDMAFLLGISMSAWGKMTKQFPDEPVVDPTLALFVRLLAEYPELCLVPRMPSAHELFDELRGARDVTKKEMSILLGGEASHAYRLLERQAKMPILQQHFSFTLIAALRRKSSAIDKSALLESWTQVVRAEGQARTGVDVFDAGTWTAEKAKRIIEERGTAPRRRGRPRKVRPEE